MKEDNDSELVSVVIPVYNRIPVLLRAIHSVTIQTHSCWEILVTDDGSDHDIGTIIKKMNDPRIQYLKLQDHKNANVARNHGISSANGRYIAMLDCDDEWLPDHLEKSLNVLQTTKADGVYGSIIINYTSGQKVCYARKPQPEESMVDYLLSRGYGAQTSTLLMGRESASDILWNEKLNRHQDYDFIVRYAKKYRWEINNSPTVIYHFSPKNYKIDYDSCISFIIQNKKEISPGIYTRYHQGMYKSLPVSVKPEIIKYYKRESVRYKREISFKDYLKYMKLKKASHNVFLLLRYIGGLLVNK